MTKVRLDKLLVAQGLAATRGEAARLIAQGRVQRAAQTTETSPDPAALDDPALKLDAQTALICTPGDDWVSRGAFKLLAGLEAFALTVAGRAAVDVGVSTGGFTQVLLARGARAVLAVDVGSDQLHACLRADPRVTVREQCDARNLTLDPALGIDLLVCDASFISLKLLLPPLLAQLPPGSEALLLIKPQFEVGRGGVNRQGVVRTPALAEQAVEGLVGWMDSLSDWRVLGRCDSPILGPNGNREVLMHAQKTA